MVKKQKSFADKAAGKKKTESVYVKYVKSVQSEKTGSWRFNEQMLRLNKGEQLDAALKRMDEVANLIDIDLSEFVKSDDPKENESLEAAAETITESVIPEAGETPEVVSASEEPAEQVETADNNPPEPDTVEERTDEGSQDVVEKTDTDEPVGEESAEISDLPEMSEEKGSSEEE